MESLSVHDLQRLGTGTSSWQQGSELVGRLVFGNDAKTIVVLQDVNTFDAIQCRTDCFNPILEGTLVSIRHWIYVRYSDQIDLLEFMLENAYEVGVPDVTLSQKFHIQAQFASQILRPIACNFQTFDQLEQCPVDKAVSFAGMVAVKPATFCGRAMMQITNERGDRAIYLAFADDKQHQNFEIGTYYVFLNVEFAVVTDGDSRHNVLKYSASSRAYAITKEKYDDLKYAGAVDMQEDHDDEKHQPVVYTRSIESANMSVYIGTVTRVVDAMFGIYEMEGKTKHDKLLLCLFHYPDYRPLYPYRVGTKLQIHHTHMVAVQNIRPSLLQSWDAPVSQHSNVETCIFLVGCLRTHVQLVALPQNSDIQYGGDWISPQMLPAIYRESTEKRLDFASLLRCLDLYDAFSKKFESPRKAFISAKRLAQLTHYERRTAFGDVYHDILEHENGCSALGDLDGTTVELVQCLPLDAVVAKLLNENRRQIDDKNFAAKTSHLEQQNVEVLQAEYGIDNEDCRNLWVLGELLSSEQDGRLYLVDASCKVPLLIQNQTPENLPLDYLVLIKRMQVVQEDLSYKTEINGKTDKYCTYITCKATDILPARSPVRENGIPERLTSSDPLEISDIVGFKVENRKVSVILVLRVYPVTLTHDSDTTINTNINDHDPFYYKSSIRALRYPVNGPIHEMPTEISISLDSRSKSLKYWSQLQPGYFYVIEGDIDNDENCRVYKTFRKDLKIPRNINTAFKLDGVRHHLYPLVYAPNAGGEQLHAIISSSAPQTLINSLPRQRKIYQVRDLFLPLDDTRSPMRIETEKLWIEKPIDLQGVIIAKKFREIHAPKGLLYFRAQESLGRHGAGTGEPGRGLFFRVRQIDGLDTVDIYMNVSYRTWPLGLIPGSIVTFHNLFWKSIKNMNGFYCTAEAPTTWSVDVPSLERAEYILTTNIATRDLSEHNMANVESEKNLLYKTTCWIQHIIQMELQWQCLECGSFIKNDRCEGACSSNRRIFIAEATVRVEDEKGSAVAMFDGERLIMKLLGLTQRQADRLKETVRIRGPFFYGNWLDCGEQVDDEESSNDEEEGEEEENRQETKASPKLTLRDACQRIERGRQIYNLYVRRIIFKRPQGQKYESLLEHGLRKTTFYYKSGFFDCLTYKMSRLKVLELEHVSMAAHAWNYLAKMPQHH